MARRGPRPPIGDPGDSRGFEVLTERFLESLGVRGYSERTLATASHALRLVGLWCVERGMVRPEEVSRDAVERYQRHLYHLRKRNGQPLSLRTQHNRLVHVKSFFRWLAKERYLLYNPASELELPKYNRRLPTDGLTAEESERVIAGADVAAPLGVRDRAILETFYSTGMRRMELAGLDLYDVDRERGWVTIREGKGGKDRVVPIGDRALAWVVRYLEEVRPQLVVRPDEAALFLTGYGERFEPSGLTQMVRRYIEAAGIEKKGSCHLFRHACATLMLEGGADIRYIQEMLGHAKLETTQIYTQVSITKLKEIHAATHPARLERTSTLAAELAGEGIDDGDR